MAKLIMLGTGNGGTLDLYNTCFVIQNDIGNFLVDTGGSIEIIKRLKLANIDIKNIKHIFISHSHTDHILGLIWMFKKLGRASINGEIETKINIYCNDVVYEAIMQVSKYVLPEKLVAGVLKIVEFHILNNDERVEINGINYTFFDINARGTKQFGFECNIDEKRLVFLGDETLNSEIYERVRYADYVMHEAFCLDSEENIFHAYQKNHSTVKSASKIMNELEVKNLILYHTEESHGIQRKELYTKEENKILMCKREKEPYKGKFNLVGGKVEQNENELHAAYRELQEETGITNKDIKLTHIMNFQYKISDVELELYSGKLNKNVQLIEEVNKLYWIDKNENFFDLDKYAGEGNIGHMLQRVEIYKDKLF